MLRRFLVTMIGFTLLVSGVAAPSAREADPAPIPLATGEWPPYTGAELDGGGVAVELVRAVFAAMGRAADIRFYPWRRSEAYVRHGLAWATFPYAITEARRADYFFSDPLFESRGVFFYYGQKMASFEFTELNDLRPYTIGVAAGYWYEELFLDAGLTVDQSLDDLAGLKKLQARRIDLYPADQLVGLWLIANHFAPDQQHFGIVERPLRTNQNALMVSKSYPHSRALLREFNAALQRVRKEGLYRRIMERYGIDPEAALFE